MSTIFPFAPGLPWTVQNKKFIIPKLKHSLWESFLSGKDTILVSNGGLFEVFASLMFAEIINYTFPKNKLYTICDPKFNSVLSSNGLTNLHKEETPGDLNIKYPTPIFADRKGRVYLNCLLQYHKIITLDGCFSHFNRKAALEQIFSNTLYNQNIILPKIRRGETKKFSDWKKISKFYPNKPYIVIFPDDTGLSISNEKLLNWSITQTKSFGQMLSQIGFDLIIVTDAAHKYYGSSSYKLAPIDWNIIYPLLQKAQGVISREPDFQLISLLISDNKIFTEKNNSHLGILKNSKFLDKIERVISYSKLSPANIISDLMEKNDRNYNDGNL